MAARTSSVRPLASSNETRTWSSLTSGTTRSVCWAWANSGWRPGEKHATAHRPTIERETCKNGPHHAVRRLNVAHRRDPVVTLLVPNAMIQQGSAHPLSAKARPPHRCADRCRCFRTAELCSEPRPSPLFERTLESLRVEAAIPAMSAAIVQDGIVVWAARTRKAGRRRHDRGQTRHAVRHRRTVADGRIDAAAAEMRRSELRRSQRSRGPVEPDLSGAVRPRSASLLSHTAPDGTFRYDPARLVGADRRRRSSARLRRYARLLAARGLRSSGHDQFGARTGARHADRRGSGAVRAGAARPLRRHPPSGGDSRIA